MSEARESLLRKVRALLAKANDRSVTPAEADAFRAKADELMARFAIEEFELADKRTTKPVVRRVDFSWWFDAEQDSDAKTATFHMFMRVYEHCRCAVVYKNAGSTIPVVGYDNDLDYADLLFTSLLLQLVRATNPQPDSDLDYYHNLEMLHSAGIPWPVVAERMINANIFWPGYQPGQLLGKKIEYKMTRDYRRWADDNDRDRPYPNWQTHRRSFAMGFTASVGQRIEEMRLAQSQQTTSRGTGFDLVIRDIRLNVRDVMWAEFPNMKPHPPDCDCDRCQGRGRKAPAIREKKIDYGAYGKGRAAGEEAEIIGPEGSRIGRRREQIEG